MNALEEGLRVARDQRTGFHTAPLWLSNLAEAHVGVGALDRAGEVSAEALSLAQRHGTRLWECDARLAIAHGLLRAADTSSAGAIEDALHQALNLVEETGGRSREPHIHEARAELAQLQGTGTTRERELGEAHRLYTEMGATGHAERVARELDS